MAYIDGGMAARMVGTTSPPGEAEPPPDVPGVRSAIPRWSVAVLILVVATVILWLILGKLILQAVIQGLVVGSIYVLGASGLSLTYGIKKFANFAHGDLMTVGAYAAFTMNVRLDQNILVGFAFAVFTVALVGILLELSIFRRLEGRGPVSALIASVGVSLVLQNVVSAIFTTDVQYLGVNPPPDIPLGSTGLSFNVVKGGVTLAVSAALIVFLHVMLRYTTLGKAMRACADDLELARTSGINTRNVILWTWVISGSFAAVAGVLLAIIVNVYPYLGFFVLLFIFAAVIVGGIGSPYGAMLGGLMIGIVQKLSNVVFGAVQGRIFEGGAEYEPVGAFLVMILVLLFLPEGLTGSRRAATGRRIVGLRRHRKERVEQLG
jgi:branched-chain amino acid transport system permease protein/neutral amino acid transport system permease protein